MQLFWDALMRKKRFIIISILMIPILVTAVVVMACDPSDFGTAGDDTINCTLISPPGTEVAGFDGNDTITIDAGVNVFGDVSGGQTFGGPESGNDTIVNNGTVGSSILGDSGSGNGSGNDTIINNGDANQIEGDTSFGDGSGGDVIVNNGDVVIISGDTGDGDGTGNDIIVNNGTADTIFADSADGNSSGNDNVVNNGNISSNLYGDGSGGNSDGNDTITNNGYIAGNLYGDGDFGVGTGSDNITNNGQVTNIDGAGGNDTISNNGVVVGDITAGSGNDTVIIQAGSAVVGDGIDGGADYDVLTFQLNSTDPAELEAAAAAIAAASPSGGTITINGVSYTWLNFEELTQILNIVRLNGLADPLAMFCAAAGGVDVYVINNNQGFFALFLSLQQISNGIAHAQSIGAEVQIGNAALADAYALPTGELRITHPSGFGFTLSSTRCGELPVPLPFSVVVEEEEDNFVIINRPR